MKSVNRKKDCELGSFIWNIISKTNFSLEKLAEKLDVSTRELSYYCSGERKPSQRNLLKIIKLAGGINAEDIPF